jgi:lipid-A-disaccharide synthase
LPAGFGGRAALTNFEERFRRSAIQVFEGETWDLLACADLAFAASGTVTVEAALLGTPMVTFYRVTAVSWLLGKLLVRVPFYSMVNLLAGRMVAPEVMQSEMTGERLAEEGLKLLDDAGASERARAGLREVAEALAGEGDPIEAAAAVVAGFLDVGRGTACAVS